MKAEAGRAINGITDVISSAMKKGDSVAVFGFGTFKLRNLQRVSGATRRLARK